MAELPKERVEVSAPFTYCGIDCFGPFITKKARKEQKRYGLNFTCLASRAIHIEMLEDLSTDAFINALRLEMHRSIGNRSQSPDNTPIGFDRSSKNRPKQADQMTFQIHNITTNRRQGMHSHFADPGLLRGRGSLYIESRAGEEGEKKKDQH